MSSSPSPHRRRGRPRARIRRRRVPRRRKSRALALVEQVVTPVDERAQRLLARQCVPASAGEQTEALVELIAQLPWRENPHPRRGELDCERDAVEAPADFGNKGRVFVGEREVASDGDGALDEERDRRKARGVGA